MHAVIFCFGLYGMQKQLVGKYKQVNWPGNCSGTKWICSVLSQSYRGMKILPLAQ